MATKKIAKKKAEPKKVVAVKKAAPKKVVASTTTASPSQLIDARIAELNDWRGQRLAQLRAIIRAAVPTVTEEWKWRGVPVWYQDGMLCTGESYRSVVKVTFAKGAALPDPAKLFNSSLEGNTRRAIDVHEHDVVNEAAFHALIVAAAAHNKR
jgi:hypothetical protein